jgi:ribosome biogenesis GTPase
MLLSELGWNDSLQNKFNQFIDKDYYAARICAEHKNIYKLYTEFGEILGEISGKFHYNVLEQQDYPAIGDWVLITLRPGEDRAIIHHVLPRKSKFSRKAAGATTQEQIVAANIDTVFLVNSLNQDFNIRRLERYLILAWESGAIPVIILSKSDLCEDIDTKISLIEKLAPGVPIFPISSVLGDGISNLNAYLSPGNTIALLGSSGVGKSTFINYLLGKEVMVVQEISDYKDKGKHTSTHRELFLLPQGGLIIDTPGMREIQLWDGSDGLSETFEDIDKLTKLCRFNNCTHGKEPGCAVRKALNDGTLNESRYISFKKLQKELVFLEEKQKKQNKILEKRSVRNKNSESKNKNYIFTD